MPHIWAGVAIGAIGLVLNLIGMAVGYGILQGRVTAMDARVKALESEISALTEIKVTVAEVKTSMAFLLEQVKDLNASIRWMKDPAPHSGQPVRRGRMDDK